MSRPYRRASQDDPGLYNQTTPGSAPGQYDDNVLFDRKPNEDSDPKKIEFETDSKSPGDDFRILEDTDSPMRGKIMSGLKTAQFKEGDQVLLDDDGNMKAGRIVKYNPENVTGPTYTVNLRDTGETVDVDEDMIKQASFKKKSSLEVGKTYTVKEPHAETGDVFFLEDQIFQVEDVDTGDPDKLMIFNESGESYVVDNQGPGFVVLRQGFRRATAAINKKAVDSLDVLQKGIKKKYTEIDKEENLSRTDRSEGDMIYGDDKPLNRHIQNERGGITASLGIGKKMVEAMKKPEVAPLFFQHKASVEVDLFPIEDDTVVASVRG